jgi:hypothetical protein
MKESESILANHTEFLKYLKAKFTLIHLSNVFFRDFHYGVMAYLTDHGMKLKYHDAEQVAREVGEGLEKRGILRKIDHQSWTLNYPEFALPRVEKQPTTP